MTFYERMRLRRRAGRGSDTPSVPGEQYGRRRVTFDDYSTSETLPLTKVTFRSL